MSSAFPRSRRGRVRGLPTEGPNPCDAKTKRPKAAGVEVDEERVQTGRRGFIGTAGWSSGRCRLDAARLRAKAADARPRRPLRRPAGERTPTPWSPGQLDTYYGLFSGGQRARSASSASLLMREIKRIPSSTVTRRRLGSRRLSRSSCSVVETAATPTTCSLYHEGTYDGRFIFVNDKAGRTHRRVRCDTMEVDHIVEIPFGHGTHGIFRSATTPGSCSEQRVPVSAARHQRESGDPRPTARCHTATRRRDHAGEWQVLGDGQHGPLRTDYQGQVLVRHLLQSEKSRLSRHDGRPEGFLLRLQLSGSRRPCRRNRPHRIGESQVPVVTRAPTPARTCCVFRCRRARTASTSHRTASTPSARQALATASVVGDRGSSPPRFAGEIQPQACVVAEPSSASVRSHAFDGRGNGVHLVFIDSVICK